MIIAWVKWFLTAIFFTGLFFLCAFMLSFIPQNEPIDPIECKYTIKMSAMWGSTERCAHHFTIDDMTYFMYDSKDNLVSTLTAQEGFCIESELTK